MSSVGGNEKATAKNNSTSNEPVKPVYNKYGLEFNDVKNKQEQVISFFWISVVNLESSLIWPFL